MIHLQGWDILSGNPSAIDLLIENRDKIHWSGLSANKNAIEMLQENRDKINWWCLSSNPSIFKDEPMPKIIL